MTELKTLKDLEDLMVTYDFPESKAFGHKVIATKIMRQEAIKWIKTMKYITDTGSFEIPNLTKEQEKFILETFSQATKGSIEIFKAFFNITEEELK